MVDSLEGDVRFIDFMQQLLMVLEVCKNDDQGVT